MLAPNKENNWIRGPASINVNDLKELTAVEEDKLIKISVHGDLKLQFKKNSFHFVEDFLELSKRALMTFVSKYLWEKSFSDFFIKKKNEKIIYIESISKT